jgi:hypothetical protein
VFVLLIGHGGRIGVSRSQRARNAAVRRLDDVDRLSVLIADDQIAILVEDHTAGECDRRAEDRSGAAAEATAVLRDFSGAAVPVDHKNVGRLIDRNAPELSTARGSKPLGGRPGGGLQIRAPLLFKKLNWRF